MNTCAGPTNQMTISESLAKRRTRILAFGLATAAIGFPLLFFWGSLAGAYIALAGPMIGTPLLLLERCPRCGAVIGHLVKVSWFTGAATPHSECPKCRVSFNEPA